MAPRTRPLPEPIRAKLSLDVARRVRASIEGAMRGEFVDLSPEETRRYGETGELPERVERWLDSLSTGSTT
jgi:hypothetical protein